MSRPRYEALDALRGLAASSVVLHHFLLAFPAFFAAYQAPYVAAWAVPRWPEAALYLWTYTPLHVLWAGHEAVILFFVLSGFVLALPFLGPRRPAYLPFAVKRVFRIYPPYVAAMLASAALMAHGSVAGASTWFTTMWAQPVGSEELAAIFTMPHADTHNLDTAAWSLVHELRISLVFPLLVPLAGFVAGPVASLIFCLGGWTVFWPGLHAWAGWFATAYYGGFFLLGAALARHAEGIRAALSARSERERAWLLGLALLLYNMRWQVPLAGTHELTMPFVADWAAGLGSALLIALALVPGPLARLLAFGWARWLGRISYSLYLCHAVVLLAVVHALAPAWPLGACVAAAAPVALAVAAAFHQLVEAPSQALGRRLAARPALPVAAALAVALGVQGACPPACLADVVAGVPTRAWLPAATGAAARPVVVYIHGHGGHAADLARSPERRAVLRALLEAGNVVLASDYGDPEHWGNAGSLADTLALVDHYRGVLGLQDHHPALVLESMGALPGLQLAAQGLLSPRAIVAIYPVFSLEAMVARGQGFYAPSVAHAFRHGGLAEHDPGQLADWRALKGMPLTIWASEADLVVPRRTHAAELARRAAAAGAVVSLREARGDHGDPSHFQPAAVARAVAGGPP